MVETLPGSWSKWQDDDGQDDYKFNCPACGKLNLINSDQIQDGFECWNCGAEVRLEADYRVRARVTSVKAKRGRKD